MAQQYIDFGTFPDDPDADAIRTAFQKVQNNFNQLFTTASSGTVQTISSPAGGGIDVSSPAGNVVLIANIACVQVHTSTLSVGIGANGLSDTSLTQSSQILWIDLPANIANVQSINLAPTTFLTSSVPAVRVTQTWNAAANTFTAILANITDSNSASSSKLIDLQVNSASKFSVSKAGDVSANSISVAAFSTGDISVGNGSFSGNILATGNVTGGNLNTSGVVSATGNVSGANLTATSNVIAGNMYANSGTIGASLLTGTLTTAAQPNITSVGTLTSLAVTGNITSGNVYANSGTIGASLLTGTLTTNAQPNVTSLGTLTSLSVTGNITSGNVYANSGTIGASLLTGTLTTATQPNITSLGTLTSLTVSGNANVGNLNATTSVVASTLVSNVTTGTAPITVSSTTRVANLNVAYANVTDFSVVTAQTTGTYYPTFISGSSSGNYALNSNSSFSANLANGGLIATTFIGNLSGNVNGQLANGTSNVAIPATNGNVNISVGGNANVLSVTPTGANITGTINATGNVTVGNLIFGNAGISANGSFGTRGQTLKSDGNNNSYWSTQFYYGNTPPNFPDLNYGDIFFYIDNPNNFQRLYMWVTDGSSDYFYDFLPPSF